MSEVTRPTDQSISACARRAFKISMKSKCASRLSQKPRALSRSLRKSGFSEVASSADLFASRSRRFASDSCAFDLEKLIQATVTVIDASRKIKTKNARTRTMNIKRPRSQLRLTGPRAGLTHQTIQREGSTGMGIPIERV